MKNEDIRHAIEESGFKYWEVADALNISDCTFTKWLRKELDPDRKTQVLSAISKLGEDNC